MQGRSTIQTGRSSNFFKKYPWLWDLLVGLGVGLAVTGLIVATAATFGALAPALGVTLGSLTALTGSLAGSIGIGVAIAAGFALLSTAVGAIARFFTQEKQTIRTTIITDQDTWTLAICAQINHQPI